MTLKSVDLSNWQGEITPGIAACFKASGIQHVVVRASLESMPMVNLARRQMQACLDAGFTIAGYIWLYPSWEPVKTIRDAVREYGALPLVRWWIDAEEVNDIADPTRNAFWLRTALAELRSAGKAPGIYTGAWWWNDPRMMNGSTEFRNEDLWIAFYDQNPDLNVWARFGGFSNAVGKQYSGTASLCGISPIDLDVFSDAILPQQPPAPDPRDTEIQRLRDALTIHATAIDAEALTAQNMADRLRAHAQGARDAVEVKA